MTDKLFWLVIEKTQANNQAEQIEKLEAELSKLDKADLISFEASYRGKLLQAYHWDLWAGAYIINGGCSDDGFDYFCDWLISQGQTVYENALENPETLIGVATPWDTEFEEFRYVMMDVMSKKHQADFPRQTEPRPASPLGEEWDEETVNDKFPALANWVENSDTTPAVTPSISSPKVSFWKRLFRKH